MGSVRSDVIASNPRKERVLLACSAKGINTSELARRLGKSRQHLGIILSGQRPGDGIWEPMAKELGVDVLWLTTGTNPPLWAKDPDWVAFGRQLNRLLAGCGVTLEDLASAGHVDVEEARGWINGTTIPPESEESLNLTLSLASMGPSRAPKEERDELFRLRARAHDKSRIFHPIIPMASARTESMEEKVARLEAEKAQLEAENALLRKRSLRPVPRSKDQGVPGT